MECPDCGVPANEGQKFCTDCGRSLRNVTDPTEQLEQQFAPPSASDEAHARDDEIVTAELPAPAATAVHTIDGAPVTTGFLATPTPIADVAHRAEATTQMDVVGVAPDGTTTDEMPLLFDGSADIHEYPEMRESFRFKLVFVFAFFGAVAVGLASIADIVDIRTTVPVDGISTGVRTLDTLGTNLGVAGFVGATVMTLGALLACFGFRWGAGLAGGAGLALIGWATLVVGLAELRVANAESVTRQTTNVAFTLRITRDVGFWLLIGVAVIGLVVFLASLRSFPTGGRPALNPWIAALGAVAGVILAAGPLLPVDDAVFADNFGSPTGLLDLPTIYFAGRLAQVGLIAFATVFGLLTVRTYGLGLAAGGVSVAFWMWLTALIDAGSAPLGIAAGNFGASDTTPHAVTTVGMAATLLMLVVAALLASLGHRRWRNRPKF